MTVARLSALQWIGVLAGAAVWWAQHALGFGITQAECNVGGAHWGISNDVWEGALLGAAALALLAAEAASLAVLRATRAKSYEEGPPVGRIRFFAITACAANPIFLVIVLLDGFASIFNVTCAQS